MPWMEERFQSDGKMLDICLDWVEGKRACVRKLLQVSLSLLHSMPYFLLFTIMSAYALLLVSECFSFIPLMLVAIQQWFIYWVGRYNDLHSCCKLQYHFTIAISKIVVQQSFPYCKWWSLYDIWKWLFYNYRIAGNFWGSKLSRIHPKIIFMKLIFANFSIQPFCTVLFIISQISKNREKSESYWPRKFLAIRYLLLPVVKW